MREALVDKAEMKKIIDYTNPLPFSYAPNKGRNFNGSLLAEIDGSEALAAVTSLEWCLGGFALLSLGAVVATLLIARSISRPVVPVGCLADEIASGRNEGSDSGQALSQGATESERILEEKIAPLNQVSLQSTGTADHANKLTTEVRAAVAEELSGQAEQMRQMLLRFNLKGQNNSQRTSSSAVAQKIEWVPESAAASVNNIQSQIPLDASEFGKF